MTKPSLIYFGKDKYYLADDLFNYAKKYCDGSQDDRELVKNNKIPKDDLIYAKEDKKKEWIINDGVPKKLDKVLISKEYVEKNVLEFSKTSKYETLPPLLKLIIKEKLRDRNNDIIDIKIRGDRNYGGCYFDVADISDKFDFELSSDDIKDKSIYKCELDIHYKYFNFKNNKTLFLTYAGLLQVMVESKPKSAKILNRWAKEILFNAVANKQKTIDNKLDVYFSIVKNIHISCIYLFELGTFGSKNDDDIVKSFSVNKNEYDDDIYTIAKFGKSKDLSRRVDEHIREYGAIRGVNIKLILVQPIDPNDISEAETMFKKFSKNKEMSFEYKTRDELIVYNHTEFKSIEKKFCSIGTKYGGNIDEITEAKKEVERENKLLKKDVRIEILKGKNKLLKKDAIIETHTNKIKLLENEIKMLKKDKKK